MLREIVESVQNEGYWAEDYDDAYDTMEEYWNDNDEIKWEEDGVVYVVDDAKIWKKFKKGDKKIKTIVMRMDDDGDYDNDGETENIDVTSMNFMG